MFQIPSDLLGLEDSVALVTGGARGIAKGCAIKLAQAGCHIAIADVDEATATATAEEIRALGRRAAFLSANVRSRDDVHSLVDRVRSELGGLDVALNAVGNPTGPPTSFLDYSEEEWDEDVQQNLKSALLCCQAEAVSMIEHATPGRIINVASSSGVVGAPTVAAYGAANAGVIHATKSMAMELAPYGIRVNCIVPGTHATERIQARLDAGGPEAEFLELASKAPPLGRLGDPLETGGVAVFLASNLSSYVTGHAILSDGGVTHTTARPPVGLDLTPRALAHVGKPAGESR